MARENHNNIAKCQYCHLYLTILQIINDNNKSAWLATTDIFLYVCAETIVLIMKDILDTVMDG